jgi:signal transduction histidine kinase
MRKARGEALQDLQAAQMAVLVGGWCLLRKALAPLDTLTRAAERINADNLRDHLPRTGNGDEVDRLSEVLNAMTTRLDDSFTRIREFTLNASHELKTPLAVMHGELETAISDPVTTPAQRELFASQLDELQRLTQIVDGLTLLAKADAGQAKLAQECVLLDELVMDSFTDAQILAQTQKIQVDLVTCDKVSVWGDRHRLRQLLLILTDNAIKYNHPQGRVEMTLKRNGHAAELKISNTGAGISATLLPRVFDRFFRGDPSHNNTVEGCGLGLSIAQWIVKAQGGKIQITSEPESLTTVTVSLPIGSSASNI